MNLKVCHEDIFLDFVRRLDLSNREYNYAVQWLDDLSNLTVTKDDHGCITTVTRTSDEYGIVEVIAEGKSFAEIQNGRS